MSNVSTHLIHGFKTALAAVLAYYLTTILSLDFGYWAVISAVIVMHRGFRASLPIKRIRSALYRRIV